MKSKPWGYIIAVLVSSGLILGSIISASPMPQGPGPCELVLTDSGPVDVPPECYESSTYTFTTAIDGCCTPACQEEEACQYKLKIVIDAETGTNCGFRVYDDFTGNTTNTLCATSMTYRTVLRTLGCGTEHTFRVWACDVTCQDPPGCIVGGYKDVSNGKVECTACT